MTIDPVIQNALQAGMVIPAHPLALDRRRGFDERRQRALTRYYIGAGAGGLALGVHTTQFAIHDPKVGLLRPVLELAAEEMNRADEMRTVPLLRVGGVCGATDQAIQEASQLRELGYHTGLLSLAVMKDADEDQLIEHCEAVGRLIPIFGFYLQPQIGGPVLPYSFWRRFAEIDSVVAIKVAPFNRYQTIEVVRAVADAGREDVALYTGNDDHIVMDLLTPFCFRVNGDTVVLRIVGGLLGHWAVWTRKAVELLDLCQQLVEAGGPIPQAMVRLSNEVTDANAAIFDAANHFAGCIAGIHEVLQRQGLLEGIWCLDPRETLGAGQKQQIDRVLRAYPDLNDDAFVAQHLDQWLSG